MRWLAFLGMAFALVGAGCGGGDEEVVTSFGNFPTGDYCGTLLTARVFIAGGLPRREQGEPGGPRRAGAQFSQGDQS
jgi:hypothetical protein